VQRGGESELSNSERERVGASSVLINVHVVCVMCLCSAWNVSCQHVFTCFNVRVLTCQKLKNPNTHV
jgi:hypothetical protein